MKELKIILDASHHEVVGLHRSWCIDIRVLATDTAESHTVPTGARYVLFSATADFWVKFDGAAIVPAADVTDGSGPVLNPSLRALDGATAIGLKAATNCTVCMEFYG